MTDWESNGHVIDDLWPQYTLRVQ